MFNGKHAGFRIQGIQQPSVDPDTTHAATHSEVWSRIEGLVGETDRVLKIVRFRKFKRFGHANRHMGIDLSDIYCMKVCSELNEEREAEKQIGIVTSPSGQRRTWQRVDNQRLSGVNGNKL